MFYSNAGEEHDAGVISVLSTSKLAHLFKRRPFAPELYQLLKRPPVCAHQYFFLLKV